MEEALKDSAYEFGSTSYQDRCKSIKVSYSGSTIYVRIAMYVLDRSYCNEVKDNIDSIIDSIRYQYGIGYAVDYSIDFEFKY